MNLRPKPFAISAADSFTVPFRLSSSPSNGSCMTGISSGVLITIFDEPFMALVHILLTILNKRLPQELFTTGV